MKVKGQLARKIVGSGVSLNRPGFAGSDILFFTENHHCNSM